jgi:hypothetical protein
MSFANKQRTILCLFKELDGRLNGVGSGQQHALGQHVVRRETFQLEDGLLQQNYRKTGKNIFKQKQNLLFAERGEHHLHLAHSQHLLLLVVYTMTNTNKTILLFVSKTTNQTNKQTDLVFDDFAALRHLGERVGSSPLLGRLKQNRTR